MVSKKLLSAAIAGAFLSVPAFANFNGSITSPAVVDPIKVAQQSLVTTGKVTVSGTDYFVVTKGAAADFDFEGKLGIGLAVDQKVYIRVDLTNAVFKTAVTNASLTVTDSNTANTVLPAAAAVGVTADTLSQGGASGQNYAVFSVTPTGTEQFETGDDFILTLTDLAATGSGNVGIKVTAYDTVANAVNATNVLSTVSSSVLTFSSGATVTSNAVELTADVDQVFKQFVAGTLPSVSKGLLGNIAVAAAASTAAASGAAVAIADVANTATSTVKYEGDFSVGIWWLDAANTCATVPANQAASNLTLNSTKTSTEVTLAVQLATPYLCVQEPTGTNAVAIPASSYKSTVTYAAVANAAKGALSASSNNNAGSIVRNGTTVQVPYVTTFADYAQRLVLVNRGGADVAYTVTFTPETGVTATPGTAATGTLKAKSTTIIPVTSLVTLTGATRTAATVAIVSAQANIDAATTQVNLADKATDTVKLK